MELTFLGSSNAFAAEGRYWSSFIADRKYVFDAPPTLLPHLKQLKVPLDQIEVVFLTHFHADHFVGLPFLYLEYVFMTKRSSDLFIVGPPGVEDTMEDFANRCYREITRDVGYKRLYVEAKPGTEQKAGNIGFCSVPMNHVKDTGIGGAYGYRAQINGKSVAYTGDTMFCEDIYELGKGADVLVVDCTYAEGGGPEHMGLEDVKVIRQKLPPETAIVLTHRNGEPKTDGMANVHIARDMETLRFP